MHAYNAFHRFSLIPSLVYHQQRLMAGMRLRKRGGSDSKQGRKLVKVEYEEDKIAVPDEVADVPTWEPKNWRDQFDNIRKMREKADAPVDNVGAAKLADTTVLPEVLWYYIVYSFCNMCTTCLTMYTEFKSHHFKKNF